MAYRVRAGDQFLISSGEFGQTRMSPGATFGPGSSLGATSRVLFRIKDFDVKSDLDACARAEALQAPLVRRLPPVTDAAVGFVIDDQFKAISTGFVIDQGEAQNFPYGRLPSHMAMAVMGGDPFVFVSFSGSGFDNVLVFDAFEANLGNMFLPSNYQNIR